MQRSSPAQPSAFEHSRTDLVITCVLILGFLWLSLFRYFPGEAADIFALWYAGRAFAAGQFDQIYAAASELFTMLPPDGWVADRAARGIDRALYPFIYPPLWAWLMSFVTQNVTQAMMLFFTTALHAACLVGMFALTWRIFRPSFAVWKWLLFGLGLSALTFPVMIAQVQNQPQIIVSFLIVLALERSLAGRPAAAGIAMAFAAAIKLYPLIFAVLWLFSGRIRETAWFAATGAALGIVSLIVAGWPLHAAFLGHVSAISNTALLTSLTYAFDPMIAQLAYPESFLRITPDFVAPEDEVTWAVAAKPLWHTLLNKVWLIAFLIAASLTLSRQRTAQREATLWPLLMGIFGLIGPISWSYHYLSVMAFLPLIVLQIRTRTTWFWFIAAMLAISPVPYMLRKLEFGLSLPILSPIQIVSTLGILGITLLFWRFRKTDPA